MKKRWMTGWIIALASIAVFCACTHSGESDQATEPTPETAKNVDEIIRDAEKNTYLSGDADEELLYTSGDLPFGSVVPAFLQLHTPDEFPAFDGDERFFRPASDDYLIASFEEGKTMIYEFFGDGSLIALRGRIVYETKEALLKENADKVLKEDDLSETGYTYHGNVLYYIMPQDALFAAEYRIDKQKLLKTASSGAWKEDLYWFSKPYDDPVSAFDAEKWDEILSILDAVIPDPEYAEPNEAEPADPHPLDEETVRELFTDLMK